MSVRETLVALGKIFRIITGVYIEPESYRQAKYANPLVAGEFYMLVEKLTTFLETGCINATTNLHGASCSSAQPEVKPLKERLQNLGFPKAVRDGHSRDLVLVLAWMLAKYPLIDMLVVQFLTYNSIAAPSRNIYLKATKDFPFVFEDRKPPWKTNDQLFIEIKYLQGRLRGLVRLINQTLNKNVALSETLKNRLETLNGNHYTSGLAYHKVLLVNEPGVRAQFAKDFELFKSLTNVFVKWKRCEPMFWKWLESIATLKLEEWKLHQLLRSMNSEPEPPCHIPEPKPQPKREESQNLSVNFQNNVQRITVDELAKYLKFLDGAFKRAHAKVKRFLDEQSGIDHGIDVVEMLATEDEISASELNAMNLDSTNDDKNAKPAADVMEMKPLEKRKPQARGYQNWIII